MVAGLERDDGGVDALETPVHARRSQGVGLGMAFAGALVSGGGQHAALGVQQHAAHRRVGRGGAAERVSLGHGLGEGGLDQGRGRGEGKRRGGQGGLSAGLLGPAALRSRGCADDLSLALRRTSSFRFYGI